MSVHPFQNQIVPNDLYVVIFYHLSILLMGKTSQNCYIGHVVVVDDHYETAYDGVYLTGDVLGGIVLCDDTHILVHLFLNEYDGKNIVTMNFDCVATVLIGILNHVTRTDMIFHDSSVVWDCNPGSSLDWSHALHNNHNGFHKTEIVRIVYFFFCAEHQFNLNCLGIHQLPRYVGVHFSLTYALILLFPI